MTDSVATTHPSIQQFIAEAHEILDRRGAPVKEALEEIGERMKVLTARDDLEQLKEQAGGGRLYSEPDGLQLMLAQFDDTTAIHTHGAWGVEVGYRGRERYTQWVREDDGSQSGHARLRMVNDQTIERGRVGYWFAPPNDIHRQWPEGGPSVVLILMGNPPGATRLYFDTEHNTYTEGTPAQMHYSGTA